MEGKKNRPAVEEARQVHGHKEGQESKLEKCDENKSNEDGESEDEEKINVSCQTETSAIYQAMKEEFELEKAKMRNTFIRDRTKSEMILREEYDEIIKAKNTLIQVLTEEKDFLWSELKNLRTSYDLLARRVENPQDIHHSRNNNKSEPWDGYHDTCCQASSDVAVALRTQKEDFVRIFEEERMQMFRRCEREKIMLTEIVEKECDVKYTREKTYLLESIDGLKEGLTSLTNQKDELARIFEGEKNAMELSFARKEKDLKEELKLELQKKLVQAHASWTKTQI